MRHLWILAVLCSAAFSVRAADIIVEPGDKTLAAAAAKARSGDVLRLKPGRYTGSVTLDDGVTLEGAGADLTILESSETTVIKIRGRDCTIRGVEVRPGGPLCRTGLSSWKSVRVERCRFRDFADGISLTFAPLVDIILCEFIKCERGIKALDESSPTIWGCRFDGCFGGVWSVDGAPRIQNCLFIDSQHGVWLSLSDAPIVRNNVFVRCTTMAFQILVNRSRMVRPSIRNNLVVSCALVARTELEYFEGLTHLVVHDCPEPLFKDTTESPILVSPDTFLTSLDPGLSIAADGKITVTASDRLAFAGVREGFEPPGTPGTIGLTIGFDHPGCGAPADLELPPVRFKGPVFLANCVKEEYRALEMWGLKPTGKQSSGIADGRHYDDLEVTRNGQPEMIRFDTESFFGESGLTP